MFADVWGLFLSIINLCWKCQMLNAPHSVLLVLKVRPVILCNLCNCLDSLLPKMNLLHHLCLHAQVINSTGNAWVPGTHTLVWARRQMWQINSHILSKNPHVVSVPLNLLRVSGVGGLDLNGVDGLLRHLDLDLDDGLQGPRVQGHHVSNPSTGYRSICTTACSRRPWASPTPRPATTPSTRRGSRRNVWLCLLTTRPWRTTWWTLRWS